MTPRRGTTALAWSLFALWAAMSVTTVWIGNGQPSNTENQVTVALVGYAVVGALVASRHPTNATGWLLLASALTIATGGITETYAISRAPGYAAFAWVSGWNFHAWFYLTVVFLPLLFPTGRVLSPRWRMVWWFDTVCLVGGVVVIGLLPGRLASNAPVDNPLATGGTTRTVVEALSRLALPTYAIAVALTGLCLAIRFRRSTGAERQQLKWFGSAVLMAVVGLALAWLGEVLPPRWGDPIGGVGWSLFLASVILGIPVATGIGIMRYRLYDIDLVISRTLIYLTLTATLAVTYVGSILLLRLVLSPITGRSDLAVAGSTLAAAAVFRPARSWIQEVVNRRFYRRRYDAVHTLEDFTTRLRHELDLDAIGTDLRRTADHTLQPAHVTLWLRATNR
jgi:hypothetical protein